MRFDDTLDTVLAADLTSAFGRQSAYRQLVDLIGRGRVAADDRAIQALSSLVADVPVAVRASCARGLAFTSPPAALIALFARDELSVAAPALRLATLEAEAWTALLPKLSPGARAVLRHRRDLPAEVHRALDSFGPVDFVLADERTAEAGTALEFRPGPPPVAEARRDPAVAGPFASVGAVVLAMPIVADAVRETDRAEPTAAPDGPFEIADVVARIDAFRERRERGPGPDTPRNTAPRPEPDRFRFETDSDGVIRWADGVGRAPLVGMALMLAGKVGSARIDAAAAGAFRQRARFRDSRLTLGGSGASAGVWLISGLPVFDPATGRFTGYRGSARRPRAGEVAAPARDDRNARPDAFRQLVHELRTPTNAIVGFAEMIEMQILGPVDGPYRDRAHAIRRHARDLLGAIDDLDLAARIESEALTLHPEAVSLRAVIGSVVDDLLPLAELRGAVIAVPDVDQPVRGDRHAIERLVGRLLATLLAATRAGERIGMTLSRAGDDEVVMTIVRPAALSIEAGLPHEDAEDEATLGSVPLGTGFALRLVGNLARELGGALSFDERELVVRLPADDPGEVQRARNH